MQRQLSTLSVASVRGYQVREEATAYDGNPIDPDPDSDLDETKRQKSGGGDQANEDIYAHSLSGIDSVESGDSLDSSG